MRIIGDLEQIPLDQLERALRVGAELLAQHGAQLMRPLSAGSKLPSSLRGAMTPMLGSIRMERCAITYGRERPYASRDIGFGYGRLAACSGHQF